MESHYLLGEIGNMICEHIFFHSSKYFSDEIIQIETMEMI